MPNPGRKFSLGDFSLKLDPSPMTGLYDTQTKYPSFLLQRQFLDALARKPPLATSGVTLAPGVDIPREALLGLANFIASYASNAPTDFLDGISLSTDHVNKGLGLMGIRQRIPSGLQVIYNKERSLFGIRFEGSW